MQIAGKDVKNLLMNKVLYSWIRCFKKKLKKKNPPKRHLFIFLTREWTKHIPIWNRPSDDYNYNLQFIAPKIILPKLV